GHPAILSGAKSQGSNSGCIFLGKAMEFGVPNNTGDSDSDQTFATYPLVGNQQATPGGVTQEVSSYSQALPVALAPDSGGHPAGVNHSEFSKTENGLSFKKVTYHFASPTSNPTSTSYAVFALADSLSDYAPNVNTGDLNSATEKLNLYYFGTPASQGTWAPMANSGDVVTAINTKNVTDTGATLNSVDLCFDGGTGQTATITITGLGQLSVTLKVSNLPC
ncbi:MAG: hypothetical protein ACREGB_00265, partial [Candidatus Saccharimonadales bacterium]